MIEATIGPMLRLDSLESDMGLLRHEDTTNGLLTDDRLRLDSQETAIKGFAVSACED